MDDISKLHNATAQEVERLRAAQITGVDQLWAAIGADYDNGIALAAGRAGLSPDRLLDLLAGQAVAENERGESSWLQQHWLDAVLLVGGLLVLMLALRALGLPA